MLKIYFLEIKQQIIFPQQAFGVIGRLLAVPNEFRISLFSTPVRLGQYMSALLRVFYICSILLFEMLKPVSKPASLCL